MQGQGLFPRQPAVRINVIAVATLLPIRPPPPGIPALPAAPDADKGNGSQRTRQNKGFGWMLHQIPKLNYVTEGKLEARLHIPLDCAEEQRQNVSRAEQVRRVRSANVQ